MFVSVFINVQFLTVALMLCPPPFPHVNIIPTFDCLALLGEDGRPDYPLPPHNCIHIRQQNIGKTVKLASSGSDNVVITVIL